jgi:hypothetical protein
MNKKLLITLVAGMMLISAIFFGGFTVRTVYAQDVTPTTESDPQNNPAPVRPFGYANRWVESAGDDFSLADALGLSVEEVQKARQEAFDSAVELAISNELITAAQAEMLKERTPNMGWGMLYNLVGQENADLIDADSLFAEALNISLEALQEAWQQNLQDKLQNAVETGRLTQAEADAILARRALIGDENFQNQLRLGFQAAIQTAVENGKLTEAQGQALQNEMQFEFQNRFGRNGGMQSGMFGGARNGGFGGMQTGQGSFGGPGRGGRGGAQGFGPGSGDCSGICPFYSENGGGSNP